MSVCTCVCMHVCVCVLNVAPLFKLYTEFPAIWCLVGSASGLDIFVQRGCNNMVCTIQEADAHFVASRALYK